MILAFSPWWSGFLPLGAALGYAALAWVERTPGAPPSRWVRPLLAAAWALHGLSWMVGLLQRPVHFGFAPALSLTAWMVLTVYLVEVRLYPQLRARWPLALIGLMAVLLAWALPGTVRPDLLTHWLPLHWALGFAAYGLLAAAVVHAWLMQRAEQSIRQATPMDSPLPLLALERLTFRLVGVGFALLSATLLVGAGFAITLHPEGWVWDHKTIFTALSWLTLGVLLWGRRQRGWRGRVAARMVYASAAFLLLGYVGSRFVLEVLLDRP